MKRQAILILFLIGFFSCISIGQENNTIKNSIKIYSNFEYLASNRTPRLFIDPPSFYFQTISIGFNREKIEEGRFMELSFSFYKKSDEGLITKTTFDSLSIMPIFLDFPASTNETNIGLRLEFGRWVKKMTWEKLKIGWSASFRGAAHFSDLSSSSIQVFPIDRKQYFVTLNFIPRIKYEIGSNFYLDLNFPFDILSVGLDFQRTDNPSLTENQKDQTSFDFNVGGEALIRFGVGYSF